MLAIEKQKTSSSIMRKRTYNEAGQFAVFGNNILDQLGGHIGVVDVDLHHVADPSQRLNLGLHSFECLELAGRNHNRGTKTGQLMRNAPSNA